MKNDIERRAWLETMRPEMVEILEAAVTEPHQIDREELAADIKAAREEFRAKHPRRRLEAVH